MVIQTLLGMMFYFVALHAPDAQASVVNPKQISVLSQNIWGLPGILVKNKKIRINLFCKELEARVKSGNSWDAVFLQEIWMMRDQAILKDCGYSYVAEEDTHLWDSGLMILSHYPIIDHFRVWYNVRAERHAIDAEIFAHKSALFALIEHPVIGKIWLVNTHLASPDQVGHTNTSVRIAQIKQMAEAVRSLDPSIPVILGGDLNTGTGIAHDAAWDAFLSEFPQYEQMTHEESVCTKCPPNRYERRSGGKMDHLFSSPLLIPVSGGVALDQSFYIRRRRWPVNFADHYGWESTFEVRESLKTEL